MWILGVLHIHENRASNEHMEQPIAGVPNYRCGIEMSPVANWMRGGYDKVWSVGSHYANNVNHD